MDHDADSSAQLIARAVRDLQRGHVRTDQQSFMTLIRDNPVPPVTVDITAIYYSQPREPVIPSEVYPCIAPPFRHAFFGHAFKTGEVMIHHMIARDVHDGTGWIDDIDAAGARWIITFFDYVAGNELGWPLMGPGYRFYLGVAEDGTALWSRCDVLPLRASRDSGPPSEEEIAEVRDSKMRLLMMTLNFLNCRNIEIVEPRRRRGVRRAIERTGVQVHTINVFPVGKTTRSAKGEPIGGQPLTSVRGHFAHYGPDYNRGLLFGKHAGRFWIAQHGRGSAEFGEAQSDYRLIPE